MTAIDLYRMLRFWAMAGFPTWAILALGKYLNFWGPHAFDFDSYLGLAFIILWALTWFSLGKLSVPSVSVTERKQT